MRKHYIYILSSASLLAFTGCSNDADIANSNDGKHPIVLSVGQDAPATRAVITDGTGKTLNAFDASTDIWMVMQSEYKALSGNNAAPNDIDFKGEQTTTNCVTFGTTGDKTGDDLKENLVNFTTENTRYWDDAHARSSRLSIWAVTVPNVTGNASKWTGKTTKSWTATAEGKTIAWSVPAAQTEESVKNGDLCFSNNITKISETKDNRLKYGSDFKFEAGKLIFYHALSKITIILKEGEGFNTTATTDFNLDNITLKGFKIGGTFDVAEGEFSSTGEVTPITSMYKKEQTASQMTLEALVMPGTDLNSTLNDAVSLSVDGNAFEVSAATLKAKLIAGGATTFDKFEAGNNYVFTFTINKTDIEVTATIADWEDVTASDEAPMINVQTCYGQEGDDFAKGFSFLQSSSIDTDYSNDATVSYSDEAYTMTPLLYWPNHNTHLFFRGVWPLIGDGGTPTAKVDDKAISVSNVAYSEGTYPSDLMLGYPRTTDETCPHGYTVATSGICATEGTIRMNFQYVMSQVDVNLTTNETVGATNKVKFDANTKVEIIGGYIDGNILLSDGSATMGTKEKYELNREGTSDVKYHDAIIPQSIEDLKFRITVVDSEGKMDTYETILGIKEIEVTEGGVKKNITTWDAGKHYIYTLYITKTGVKVTATIKDWITATGSTEIWF